MRFISRSNFKKILPPLIILLVLLGVGYGLIRVIVHKTPASDVRIVVSGPKAVAPISKDFSFPLNDSKGKKIADIKFSLDTAELRDEIIVSGKRATAIQGRTFLILNLKIVNTYKSSLSINSKDYFRLTLNGNDKDLLAPDIHNDPVEVEPISSKFTRLGWPINDSDKNITLQVGEIGGQKTKIDLKFK